MSKKHFIKLAEALKFEKPFVADPEGAQLQWNRCVLAVAKTAETFNPLFDYNRFIKACGGLFE